MDALNGLMQLFAAFMAALTIIMVFLCFVVFVFGFLIGVLLSAALEPKTKAVPIALAAATSVAALLCFVSMSAALILLGGGLLGALAGSRLHACDF